MRTPLLIILVALAACARTEPADPTPGQDGDAPGSQLPNTASQDEEETRAGTWEPSAQGGVQSVTFRAPDGAVLFSISCDLRGGLVVRRPGLVARSEIALLQLRTGGTVRRLAVTNASGTAPQIEARVPYNDQLITALMRFVEPLEVRYEGLETIILPPSPIVGDLVRTCQQIAPDIEPGQPAAVPAPAEPAPAQAEQPQAP